MWRFHLTTPEQKLGRFDRLLSSADPIKKSTGRIGRDWRHRYNENIVDFAGFGMLSLSLFVFSFRTGREKWPRARRNVESSRGRKRKDSTGREKQKTRERASCVYFQSCWLPDDSRYGSASVAAGPPFLFYLLFFSLRGLWFKRLSHTLRVFKIYPCIYDGAPRRTAAGATNSIFPFRCGK